MAVKLEKEKKANIKRKAAPNMNGKAILAYPQKEPDNNILGHVPEAIITKVRTLGRREKKTDFENMLIWGDNLTALQLLRHLPQIKGRIKLIYIDPPFSTNQIYKGNNERTATVSKSENDTKAYEDFLLGADFLEFLRKRLIILKELLAADGSIYVHIDWKMGHYVKVLMDEIFGQERFINDITRIKCNPKNFERKAFGNIKDMILIYSKTGKYIWNDPREEMTEEDIKRLFPKTEADGRRYTTTPLHAPGETRNGPTGKPWRNLKPPTGRHWRYPPEELEKLDGMGLVEWSSTGNPRKKIYAEEILAKGKKKQDLWEYKDPAYPSYPTEKNLEMIRMIIETSSNPDDLVLDCFMGSGTTLLAAEETGRKWIGIDNSKLAVEVSQKRLNSLKKHSSFSLYQIDPYKKNSDEKKN